MPDIVPDSGTSPSPAEVHAALAALTEGETFRSSPRHRALLRYLVETRLADAAGRLHETVIALEVFGRSAADFDPAADPIVRVEMTRLRAKLGRYYAHEGLDAAILIDIPKGAYIPCFARRAAPVRVTVAEAVVDPARQAAVTAAPAARTVQLAVPARRRLAGGPWVASGLAALALAVAVAALWRSNETGNSVPPTVAVMPYITPEKDPQLAQLGELIGAFTAIALARLPDVKVLAPASVGAALQSSTSPPDAARKLAADYMIAGNLARSRDHVVMETRLVRMRDNTELAARRVSALPERAIDAQSAITTELLAKLSGHATAAPVAAAFAAPADPQARDKWMTARMLGLRFSPQGFAEALPLLAEIIAREPDFAPAYGMRASALWWSSLQRGVPLRAGAPEMRALAEQALALDSRNAPSYVTLAAVATVVDFDLNRGEALYRQAVRLEPGSASAHQALAGGLLYQGRYDEALAEIQLARALSPLEVSVRLVEALVLAFAQRYDRAEAGCADILRAEPQNLRIVAACAYIQSLAGHYDLARAATSQLAPRSAAHPIAGMVRAYAHARGGNPDAAQAEYRALTSDAGMRDAFAYEEATLLLALGDRARALARLDAAFVHAEPVAVGVDPGWDDMRGESAFRELLGRRAPQLLAISDQRLRRHAAATLARAR